jgi:integrase
MGAYSIFKCIRTDKPLKRNGKYPIYLRVRVRYEETKFPTGLEVWQSRWDNRRKEPKDEALRVQLNKKIIDLDMFVNRALADGQELSLDLFRSFYTGKREVKPEDQSFYQYYLDFVERKAKEGLSKETIRVYMTTYNVLKEFKKEFLISDLSLKLIEDFDDHMRVKNGNAPGGRHPKHKNLRTVILDIQKHNIPVDNPYKWFKMPSSQAKEVYLDKSELARFAQYAKKFGKDTTEGRVFLMYLFSCYTGLRWSDAVSLQWNHIDTQNRLVKKKMVKTKSEVIVPLFPMAYDILLELSPDKALFGSDKQVFHTYCGPTYNDTLRKHLKILGINKYVTYHSSRHTFATLLVLDGVDIYKIQKYLGHKSVNMTERYLKYDLSIAKESAKDINTFS